MTNEQRAREVACIACQDEDGGHTPECDERTAAIITLMQQARREEREACAVYCENHQMGVGVRHTQGKFAGYVAEYRPRDAMSEGRHEGMAYAAAIRARTDTTEREDG